MSADQSERVRRAARLQLSVWITSGIAVFVPIAWFLLARDIRDFFSDPFGGSLSYYWVLALSILFAGMIAGSIAFTAGFWVALRFQRRVDGSREQRSRLRREAVARRISERGPSGPSSSPAHPRP